MERNCSVFSTSIRHCCSCACESSARKHTFVEELTLLYKWIGRLLWIDALLSVMANICLRWCRVPLNLIQFVLRKTITGFIYAIDRAPFMCYVPTWTIHKKFKYLSLRWVWVPYSIHAALNFVSTRPHCVKYVCLFILKGNFQFESMVSKDS